MKLLAILACKLLRFVGGLLGKGSSLPGRVALKLDPNILSKLTLPDKVIAVTGSNGKTSTVEMIAHVLKENGVKVAYNKEGSNQIEGVTTLLLCDCTLAGRCRSEVVLLESDERFARHTFRHFTPTHYVITNLYRDQLTRNGHPEWIFDILRDSIHPGTRLILNADDPLVSCFAAGDNPVTWFGVERMPFDEDKPSGRYHDGACCPRCKAPMEYEFVHYNHIGTYRCSQCGLHRNTPQDAVTEASLAEKYLVINGKHRVDMSFAGIYHVYNTLAAFSACRELGLPEEKIAAALSGYALQNGRIVSFRVGDKAGTLLASKHENSVSYDQSIRVAAGSGRDVTVLVIVDAISRKYFTSETSWLWDIDFERLGAENVKRIVLAGKYCYDLASRFDYCGLDPERVAVMEDIGQATDWLRDNAVGHIYAITCFSDKDKLLGRVQVEGGRA